PCAATLHFSLIYNGLPIPILDRSSILYCIFFEEIWSEKYVNIRALWTGCLSGKVGQSIQTD
ncbi:hypothetical protein M5D96_011278, partial [Drosophila gunungcola]